MSNYENFKASNLSIGKVSDDMRRRVNKVRSFAFPNAYFEKDNKISSRGSQKGDPIFP